MFDYWLSVGPEPESSALPCTEQRCRLPDCRWVYRCTYTNLWTEDINNIVKLVYAFNRGPVFVGSLDEIYLTQDFIVQWYGSQFFISCFTFRRNFHYKFSNRINIIKCVKTSWIGKQWILFWYILFPESTSHSFFNFFLSNILFWF